MPSIDTEVDPALIATIEVDPEHKRSTQDCYAFYTKQTDGIHRRCKICQLYDPNHTTTDGKYVLGTASGTLRSHLMSAHLDVWVDICDLKKFAISGPKFIEWANEYRQSKGCATTRPPPTLDESRRSFTQEGFVDAIAEWIVGDSQSINAIESPRLRAIFLMLREELKNKDIPHRSHIRNRIIQMMKEHLDELEEELGLAESLVRWTVGPIQILPRLWLLPRTGFRLKQSLPTLV
ncbi:hypothetical protein K435DRAFT_440859 [Dendrothele bispora CBS 962.96]|uniref:Uncharacterized protein n=1 Tax=Dendrothele bispora (strain CBS 962.96) TaxID=1314807 RepID=A0A4V4HCC8_DENBC|nr:hypothetical protein K435DRAFT_440859 [Dendrothele bispora CBS 962.96]